MLDLYIVQTNIKPGFLDVCYAADFPEEQQKRFKSFLDKIAEQYSKINLPIFAIVDPERVIVPDHINAGGRRMSLPRNSESLSAMIDKYMVGEDTIYLGMTTPIKAVIDFTDGNIPQFEKAYDLLSQKYQIKKIDIRD